MSQQPPNPNPNGQTPNALPAGGGLDFSALLNSAGVSPAPIAPPAAPAPDPAAAAPLSFQSLLAARAPPAAARGPVSFDGMDLDTLMHSNPNPLHFVELLLSEKHVNCYKHLRYQNPVLAGAIDAKRSDLEAAAAVWREHLVKASISGANHSVTARAQEVSSERWGER